MTNAIGSNRNTTFAILKWYGKALKGIGKPEAIRILAARREFEAAWCKGDPLELFNARYAFKRVSSSKPCRARGNLYQVRFIRDYRALLAFSDDGTHCWWLDVFAKNETEQNRRIDTACDRALRKLEELQS
jgi:hypothetical protein